jgi:deoxyribodipyrimidine photo-lyase
MVQVSQPLAAGPTKTAIVWFRDDLRIGDNAALHAAVDRGYLPICVYVLDESEKRRELGAASKWWLAQSLRQLDRQLSDRGGRLHLFRGDPGTIIPTLAAEVQAVAVVWNRRYGAAEIALDTTIKADLRRAGIDAESFPGNVLNEPWGVSTKAGGPVKVFGAYWRAARARGEPDRPLAAPRKLPSGILKSSYAGQVKSVEELQLEPTKPDWAAGLRETWAPGESGAIERLTRFLQSMLKNYGDNRNRPDLTATSGLSPHLRFGEISPRQIWHASHQAVLDGRDDARADLDKFLSELGWREFSNHLLYFNPELGAKNYNTRFDAFVWTHDPKALRAWQRGRTGYPIVDAGMRQLWQTGWMHNRVRMIVGSFLVKHLLIDWREGESWFWDTLVDADPANNTASWQWIAGSGADAAPYFRIFNPITQGEKFDPHGAYVRRWVPELSRLPQDVLNKPWTAARATLQSCGVDLGGNYPLPIVDHDFARTRALAALKTMNAKHNSARMDVD